MKLLKIFSAVFAVFICGCASVEPNEKPKDAFELAGVVLEAQAVPNTGPSRVQEAAMGAVGVAALSLIENTRQAKSLTVKVSEGLSLSVPTRQTMAPGTCVRLFVDPIYRQLISDASPGIMSMPVGSTLVEVRPCR